MLRGTVVLAGLAAALLLGLGQGHAQPAPPLHIIVPYGPSGLVDILARLLARKVTENTGRPVIVENKAGASGIIGVQAFLARAAPDGNTLLLLDDTIYAINPAVYRQLPYDAARDFAPVTQAVEGPMYLMANAAAHIDSVADLIAQARARPKAINYGSPGNASIHHLGMERLALVSGIALTHVPYKGVAQATPGLISGDVSVMFAALTSVAAQVDAGHVKLLAIGSEARSAATPDVPTLAQAGVPGVKVSATIGFAARAGTPPEVIARLNEALVNALRSPEVEAKIEAFGVRVVASRSDVFSEQMDQDRQLFKQLVEKAGLRAD
ncbi:Bug family tripartite tricarboxylate transporter substrate binding protein [Bordetella hinzii]|uniref:Bug family tripartite tricarboxylate transporter substrate binding protein n=1 Tax=Bordetella hinzii TaxID=103855 RepID=UPI00114F3AE7|nr:tripartite tricarboxylate transporter substrate-binding protein [Bordetella hinzii]QDJ34581.1 hypothetical protein CBR68_20820 [Bordetella hinzii]